MSNKDSTLWILIALLVAVVLLSGGGMMGFGMGFGVIIMVLFWGCNNLASYFADKCHH